MMCFIPSDLVVSESVEDDNLCGFWWEDLGLNLKFGDFDINEFQMASM